jgi:hypothetical protein
VSPVNATSKAIILVLATLLFAGSAQAGDPYAIQNNLDGLDQENERIQALRIPVHFTLRSWQDRPFGLRLRLAATFSTSDLFDILDGQFEVHRVSSFVPGIEFVIPYRENHLFLPFLDAGIGYDSNTDNSDILVAMGLRTQFIFSGQNYIAGLEPGFQLSNRPDVDPQKELVFSPNFTVSSRRVLGFTIDGHEPDAGIYLETGYDFNALELTSVRSTNDAESAKWEIGAGFGFTRSMPKIWFFRWPRIRVGYRFGDLEGWRIRIGGDWLNAILKPGS